MRKGFLIDRSHELTFVLLVTRQWRTRLMLHIVILAGSRIKCLVTKRDYQTQKIKQKAIAVTQSFHLASPLAVHAAPATPRSFHEPPLCSQLKRLFLPGLFILRSRRISFTLGARISCLDRLTFTRRRSRRGGSSVGTAWPQPGQGRPRGP